MITTPEDYFDYLWGLESTDGEGNIINPFNNRPVLSVILPTDERTFDVDLSTRTILVPTFLSVAKDHRAETVYFLVDRYFGYKDLTDTCCLVEFINAAGEGGFYPVPFYDITSYKGYVDDDGFVYEDKMLIPWNIEGAVTKTAGNVQFALRFYQLSEDKKTIVYNIRTQVATGSILNGMDESILDNGVFDKESLEASIIELYDAKINDIGTTIYWDDLTPIVGTYGRDNDPDDTVSSYVNSLTNSN